MNEIPKRVLDKLQKAIDGGFWGDLEFKFQAGRVVIIRKTEVEKIQANFRPRYKENGDGQYPKTGN